MHLKTKIRLDHILGSIAIRPLMFFQRKRKFGTSSARLHPKNIVVIKLLGMGSIVQATPLLAALKAGYPEARLVFLTRKGNEQLTQRISAIDQTLTIDDSSILALAISISHFLKLCRGWRDTCIINLEVFSNLATLIILSSKARWKASYFRNDKDVRLATSIDILVYFNQAAPLSEVYLQIGRALNIGPCSQDLTDLTITTADAREVDDLMRAHCIDLSTTSLVLVNPNVSDLFPERRWPSDRFALLIQKLISAVPGLHVMLIGSSTERGYVEDMLQLILPEYHTHVSNVAGMTSLGGLIELIKRSKLLLTNDSGPMHFAFALGIPTLAFFGPVVPAQRLCRTNAQSAFLYHRIYCSPCVHNFIEAPCKGDNVCMQQISVEESFEKAPALLSTDHALPSDDRQILYIAHGKPLGLIRKRL